MELNIKSHSQHHLTISIDMFYKYSCMTTGHTNSGLIYYSIWKQL